MRSKVKYLFILLLSLVLVFTLAFASACNKHKDDGDGENPSGDISPDGDGTGNEGDNSENGGNNDTTVTVAYYYISLSSANSPSYSESSSVPSSYLFTQNGVDYTLSIHLDADDTFTINEVGSSASFGYSSVWSTQTALASGTSGSISVSFSATYTLTLSPSEDLISYSYTPDLSGVEITSSTTDLTAGQTYPFAAQLVYTDSTTGSGTITWSSSNTDAATVDSDGTVTAVAAGTAVITAASGSFSATVTLTVAAAEDNSGNEEGNGGTSGTVTVTGISLDVDSLSLELGDEYTFAVTIEPEDATNKAVIWYSSNSDVATVEGGVLTAVGYGTTTITATAAGGSNVAPATCLVTVSKPVTSISLDPSAASIPVGGTRDIAVSFVPSDATNQDYDIQVGGDDSTCISYTVSGSTITVTGVSTGSATLTITSADNEEASAVCTITVIAEGEAVYYISSSTATVMMEQSTTLSVTAVNDTISDISWSTSESRIATVTAGTTSTADSTSTATATVTGQYFGVATITATVTLASSGQQTLTCSVLVADDFYFLYGLGGTWEVYSDSDSAQSAGVLLDATSEQGVYTITRHFDADDSFHIAYPSVASFLDSDGNWYVQIYAWEYYDASQSDTDYLGSNLSSANDFTIKYAGTYTVTLDLSDKGECTSDTGYGCVYIKMVSLDPASVSVTGSSSLQIAEGESSVSTELTFSYAPENATVTEDMFSVEETYSDNTYADGYISVEPDLESGTIKVTLLQNPASGFTVTLTVWVGSASTTYPISVMVSGEEKTEVTAVTFDNDVYYINVNNGGDAWTTTVSASANGTVTGVTYSVSSDESDYVSVIADSGLVTASGLGTFTITATSTDNSSVSGTTKVVVYSDIIYLNGIIASESLTWDNKAAAPGDSFDSDTYGNVGFTDVNNSHTSFTLTVTLGLNDQFKIVFMGMDSDWKTAITNSGDNFTVSSAGAYEITVDLSGTTPSVTMTTAVVAQSIEFTSKYSTMAPNDENIFVATVTFSNGDTTTEGVTYTSSDEEKLTIDSSTGAAKALAAGEVTITASYSGLDPITFTVTISEDATNTVTVSLNDAVAKLGTDTSLTVSIDGAEITSVSWSSSETAVATVSGTDQTGTVTPVWYGSTTITASVSVSDGNTYVASCTVVVTDDFFYLTGSVGTDSWGHYSSSEYAASAGVLMEPTTDNQYVYTIEIGLTTSNAFQIMYPVGDGSWDYKITPSYYDASSSDTTYVNNTSDEFGINTNGTYTVTLDLSDGIAKVYIKLVSIDITSATVTVTSGSALMDPATNSTTVLSVTDITPTGATVDNFTATLSDNADGYLTISSIDTSNYTVTLTCSNYATESNYVVTVTITIGSLVKAYDITIKVEGEQETAVSSIAFKDYTTEDSGIPQYQFDVSTSGGTSNWSFLITAEVNSDASVQGVTYSCSDLTISSDGSFTVTSLGTYTVTATANGDSSYTATCEVTVYSTFYILGNVNTWTYLSDTDTSLSGTAFENYAFTASNNNKTFTFTYGSDSTWSNFVICFLGGGTSWDECFKGADVTTATDGKGWVNTSDNCMQAAEGAVITIDLSGATPVITIT
ncbi:MAG: Ig-like domain-containing protein [Prevotella sp.]|nr:Ig-like domain-containing protein [Prevotella sp.]